MESIFYKDLTGQRRLRRYARTGLLILIVLAGFTLIGNPRGAQTDNAPRLRQKLIYASEKVLPSKTRSLTPPISSTSCPMDPAEWSFIPVFPEDNYQRIEPSCVYTGVSRTAAWMLMERMGYSKTEAAQLLGFDTVPWKPVRSLFGYTNLNGPMEIRIIPEWPPHPEFKFWQVDTEGRPASAISLRGCYQTPGGSAGVICVVAIDRSPGLSVSVLREYRVTHHAQHLPGSRTFHLLAYNGQGEWILLGQIDGISLDIENIDDMQLERKRVAERLGAISWDEQWLLSVFTQMMAPLPDAWQTYGADPLTVQSIAKELDEYIPASLLEPNE